MKKLLIKISPFFLVFILANVLILNTNKFYVKGEEYLERIEKAKRVQPEYIFLGDSHSESIGEIDLEDNVYNLAFGGDGIQEMYIKTRLMLASNPNLKGVFLCSEPQLFNNSVSPNKAFLSGYVLELGEEEVYGKNQLAYLLEQIPLFNDGFIEYAKDKYLYKGVKGLFKKSKEIKKRSSSTEESTSSTGVMVKSDWERLPKNKREEKSVQSGIQDHKGIFNNSQSKELFSKIVELCKEKEVKIIGTRFPVEQLYYEQCSGEDLQKVDDFLISLQLDQNIDLSLVLQDPALFKNEDHLNQQGIKELEIILSQKAGVKIGK